MKITPPIFLPLQWTSKNCLVTVAIIMCLIAPVYAQKRIIVPGKAKGANKPNESKGQEVAKGEVNFTELANYLLAHPEPVIQKEPENDEDEILPPRTGNVDPSLIHRRATTPHSSNTPFYKWYVNGVVEGSGNIFSYYPTTGDVVYCTMVSDYLCRLSDSGSSNAAVMTISPMIIPHVDVISTQGFDIIAGTFDTLTTIVANAGPDPTYQWEINGVPVNGATSSVFISQFNNYDSVTCVLTSSGICEGISTFDWVYITVHPVGVQQYTKGGSIQLMPNPNIGTFMIRGTFGTVTDGEADIEITDMLGQVVYKNKVLLQNAKINEPVRLSNTLANGMYMLNLRSDSDNKVFHFVVER